MEAVTMLAIGTAVAAAVSGIISAVSNYNSTTETNQSNIENQNALNKEAWARDDTSFQRAVADARKAGLSPLVAAENAGFNTAPVMSTANAPQMDLSSIIGGLSSAANIYNEGKQNTETERHNKKTEQQTDKQLELQAEALLQNKEKINADTEKLDKTISAEDRRAAANAYNAEDRERINNSEETYKAIKETMGIAPEVEIVRDYEEYKKKLLIANEQYRKIRNIYNSMYEARIKTRGTSGSENSNWNIAGSGHNTGESHSGTTTYNEKGLWTDAISQAEKGYLSVQVGNSKPTGNTFTFTWPIYQGNYKKAADFE